MTQPNLFGDDLEKDFQGSEKADPMTSFGYVPPATYKGVCCAVDLKGDGKMVDFSIFSATTGTKGFKIYIEILEPSQVSAGTKPDGSESIVVTKGLIHEHVFWITKNNMPYLMRDVETIIGKKLNSLNELPSVGWAGRTLEFGIKDEVRDGRRQSKMLFINPWTPGEAKSGGGVPAASAAPATTPTPAAAGAQPAKPATF